MFTSIPARNTSIHMRVACAALLALAGMIQASLIASDRLTLQVGSEQRTFAGQILAENADEIKMLDENGQAMPAFAWKQVVGIEWDIPNYEWHFGMGDFEEQDFAKAASSFKRLDARYSEFREAARSTLLYYYAESLRRGGDVPKAMDVYDRLVSTYPRSHYFAESSSRLASLYLMTGHADKVDLLAQRVSAGGALGAQLAELYRSDALLALGKIRDAEVRYRHLASHARDREIEQLALLGQARCANRSGRAAEAHAIAREAIQSKSATPRVHAQAHLVLGNALLLDAHATKGETAQNAGKDAALEFLRVRMMYPQFGRMAAEATYQAAETFQFLAKNADRDVNLSRAYAMYKKIQDEYPSSTWAVGAADKVRHL